MSRSMATAPTIPQRRTTRFRCHGRGTGGIIPGVGVIRGWDGIGVPDGYAFRASPVMGDGVDDGKDGGIGTVAADGTKGGALSSPGIGVVRIRLGLIFGGPDGGRAARVGVGKLSGGPGGFELPGALGRRAVVWISGREANGELGRRGGGFGSGSE